MNESLAERAKRLQTESFVLDAHFDLTYDVNNLRDRGHSRVIAEKHLPELKAGGFDLVVSAIFINNIFLPEMGLRKALDQISCLHEEMNESPGQFRLCRTTVEAMAARDAGELAIFLSLEGADPLQDDIRLLRIFYELGVRLLGLVWSRRNAAADGAFFSSRQEGKKGGLTPFGVELVQAAEQLGMVIDLSHLNDEGFWDVMEVARKPLIVSHSNCRALAGTMRNLTDAQIKAVAAKGGVIGMNSVNVFIRDNGDNVTIADFVDHVDHIANLCGIEHVGLGFDLCDSFANHFNMVEMLPTRDVVKGHSGALEFTEELARRGYSDAEIRGVLGENFLRVYRQILG